MALSFYIKSSSSDESKTFLYTGFDNCRFGVDMLLNDFNFVGFDDVIFLEVLAILQMFRRLSSEYILLSLASLKSLHSSLELSINFINSEYVVSSKILFWFSEFVVFSCSRVKLFWVSKFDVVSF